MYDARVLSRLVARRSLPGDDDRRASPFIYPFIVQDVGLQCVCDNCDATEAITYAWSARKSSPIIRLSGANVPLVPVEERFLRSVPPRFCLSAPPLQTATVK